VTPPDRAALEHENWIAYLTGVAACTPAVGVRRIGSVLSLRSSMPFDWFNQVLVEGGDTTASDLLGAAQLVAPGVAAPLVRLREGLDDHLVAALTGARWRVGGPGTMTPGMVAFPIDHLAATAPTHGLEIRAVTDRAGVEDHRAVVGAGFAVPEVVAVETAGYGLLETPDCTIYVGYADGRPVTSGMGWRSGRTIGVYAISTVPAARRRGYGEAMTARVVADGIAAGCDVAALQASEAGRPIYERLGFRVEVRYDAYSYDASSVAAR
jgi:ribosomal protein S18 acetylase RimI-like enzyme